MIKEIVIIEDEKLNADRLKRLLKELDPNLKIVIVLDSVSDSVVWFQQNNTPDLIMMDIRLSDGLSFEIFEKVSINCPIVFTTAYDEYAVQAFKFNGVDYILKPVEKDELADALKKADKADTAIESKHSIDQLLTFLKPVEYRSRFLIPFRDGFQMILTSDIMYIYTDLKLTKAHLKKGSEVILDLSLDELQEQLDPKFFFRANRQFIIHVEAVSEITHYFNRKLKVILAGNSPEIIVSREKSNLLKDWLNS